MYVAGTIEITSLPLLENKNIANVNDITYSVALIQPADVKPWRDANMEFDAAPLTQYKPREFDFLTLSQTIRYCVLDLQRICYSV